MSDDRRLVPLSKIVKTAIVGVSLGIPGSGVAASSCKETLGAAQAQDLVSQCQNVSPATHPPCNASNSCDLIIGEIKRGCAMLGDDAPDYCERY